MSGSAQQLSLLLPFDGGRVSKPKPVAMAKDVCQLREEILNDLDRIGLRKPTKT